MTITGEPIRSLLGSSYKQSMRGSDTHNTPGTMRILILTSEAPPVVSGIATTVGALHESLVNKGHLVDVVSRTDFPRVMKNEIRLSTFLFFWPRFRQHLRHYDVVNLHGPVPTISEIFLILAMMLRSHNRPAIVYTHHCDIAIPSLERFCAIYNWIAGKLAHTADAVIVSSQDYKTKLQAAGDGVVHLIPWAVAPVKSAIPRPEREPGELKVLYVGQLREYKGVRVLLDAVSEASGTQVSIVGDGPLRDEVTARAALPGYEHVDVRGRLSDADLADAYMEHDVVVLPSTTTAEAFGLVLAEGMSAGCVPVASDLPGVREVASETGLLVPSNDSTKLRAAFERLRDDHDMLAQLSAKSLRRAKGFTTADMSASYEQAFRTAIGAARSKQSSMAVPTLFQEPDQLFEELAEALGVGEFSLSLFARNKSHQQAYVWKYATHSLRTHAPVARYVAERNQPLLISNAKNAAAELRPLLRRPELTSAILVPVRRTRSMVSVLGISTHAASHTVLDGNHLSIVLDVLNGAPKTEGSDRANAELRAS